MLIIISKISASLKSAFTWPNNRSAKYFQQSLLVFGGKISLPKYTSVWERLQLTK